jgi:hypothetical protein
MGCGCISKDRVEEDNETKKQKKDEIYFVYPEEGKTEEEMLKYILALDEWYERSDDDDDEKYEGNIKTKKTRLVYENGHVYVEVIKTSIKQ